MDVSLKMESKLQSAAAFVEGGIQDASDDSCSICLEAFCESDPSTVTSCKHEFHLQCILEWCQRSSQCPMCWQPISLKDPTSQELFEGVEHERNIRSNQTRHGTIFHHPALGDFELQHIPDGEIEERIIQHLATAAAMGRARHISRREGQRLRSAAQDHPELLVFSTHPNASSVGSVSSASRGEPSPAATASPLTVHAAVEEESSRHVSDVNASQVDPIAVLSSGHSVPNANRPVISNSRVSAGPTTPVGLDRAGPSDLQSFSESLKSRLNAVSMRYKDSITKNTRGWKERLFSRNTSVADIGSEVRREVSAGIASVSRMMERLDTREGRRTANNYGQQHSGGYSVNQPNNERVPESNANTLPNDNSASTTSAATTIPS